VTTTTRSCSDALVVLLDDATLHSPQELRKARAHASICPRCAGSFDDPEASQRVLEMLRQKRPNVSVLLRVLLVLVAVAQLVVACPWLFGASLIPDQNVAVAHLTRDGALGLVIATAGLLVAWRPRYALVALLVGSMVFVAQFASSVVDNQQRYVSAAFELTHLLVLALLALLAFATAAERRDTPDSSRTPPTMHSV
jgi:hypothetical protein